jgi:hypothetical protein
MFWWRSDVGELPSGQTHQHIARTTRGGRLIGMSGPEARFMIERIIYSANIRWYQIVFLSGVWQGDD